MTSHTLHFNDGGASLGPNGYVICLFCGEEATDISRETPVTLAYHVKCRPAERAKVTARIEALHHRTEAV